MNSYSTLSVWIARRFLTIFLRREFASEKVKCFGVRDPEDAHGSMRGFPADWTGCKNSGKAAESKVDLDTDAGLVDR